LAEHPGFLRDIIERPDDDTPRLVYADWLQDHGETARAEFIRLQCGLARFVRSPARQGDRSGTWEPPAGGLPASDLSSEYREVFLAPLYQLGLTARVETSSYSYSGVDFVFRRGFVEEAVVFGDPAVRRFAREAAEVFARTPLRQLRVRPERHRDDVPVIRVCKSVSSPALVRLLLRPELARLNVLDLRDNEFGDEVVPDLLETSHLAGLRILWLGRMFGEEAREALRDRFGAVVRFEEEMYWLPEHTEDEDEDDSVPF
jgi:uncharacterized protein (TIGR02996 family)